MAFEKVVAFLLVVGLIGNVFGATVVRKERSIESSHRHNREIDSICEYRAPCGWAVYTRLTRQIEYFVKNSCECPEDKKCVQDDDDISVSAYVYRCAVKEEKNDKKEFESSRT